MDIFTLSYFLLAFGRRINKDNYVWVTIGALVFIFGMIFLIAYGVWAARRKHQLKTLKKLTTDLGLDFFKKGRRNETDWCVGKYKDYNLTMQGRTVTYRGEYSPNQVSHSRKVVVYVIRLCISLPELALDGIKVGRTIATDRSSRQAPESFDEAFRHQEQTEKLPESVKTAMIEFVQKNPGALLLNEASEVSKGHLPEGGFPTQPTAVLVHDAYMKSFKNDTEKLREVLDDLTILADKIKTSIG